MNSNIFSSRTHAFWPGSEKVENHWTTEHIYNMEAHVFFTFVNSPLSSIQKSRITSLFEPEHHNSFDKAQFRWPFNFPAEITPHIDIIRLTWSRCVITFKSSSVILTGRRLQGGKYYICELYHHHSKEATRTFRQYSTSTHFFGVQNANTHFNDMFKSKAY